MRRTLKAPALAGDAALQLSFPWAEAAPADPIRPIAPGPTAPSPRPRGQRQTQLGEHTIPYELRRSRRRTIGFMIDDLGLRVTAPSWVTLAQIESALQAKQHWIVRKLAAWQTQRQDRRPPPTTWQDGEQLDYLGQRLTLRLNPTVKSVTLEGSTLHIATAPDPQAVQTIVHTWLQSRARVVFAERLPVYADRLGQHPLRWALSSARTRWGSCSADGSIRLNWRLIHLPLPLIDYVIAHELAHLREMNHGPNFWATVHRLMPDFEAARRQLKLYARTHDA